MNTIGFKHCPSGHILGRLRRNGNNIELLELFRQAIDYGQDMPEDVDVIAVIVGPARGVRCSICGQVIDWHQRERKRAVAVFE
jgi:hypothetical protein